MGPFTHRNGTVLRVLKAPGALAWVLVGALAFVGATLPRSDVSGLWASVLISSGILILATGRTWRLDRRTSEVLSLMVALGVTCAAIARLPFVWQIGLAPMAMILAVLLTLAGFERQFAPDTGQSGLSWPLLEAAHATLWAGSGIAVAMVAFAPVSPGEPWQRLLLYVAGALGGYGAWRLFAAGRSGKENVIGTFGMRVRRSDSSEANDPADWWKRG